MDGFKLVETLAKFYPEIKALYLSAYANKALLRPVMSSPAADFQPKPFTPATWLAKFASCSINLTSLQSRCQRLNQKLKAYTSEGS
jgi:CheY-like chemotaxis protein